MFFKKKNIKSNDVFLIKKIFISQFERMIVSIDMLFRVIKNSKMIRIFRCLNNFMKFLNVFTIKNHVIKRYIKIKKNILRYLSNDNIKLFFTLNC